jgi:hypothetical protein
MGGGYDAGGMLPMGTLPADVEDASQAFADVALVRGAAPTAVVILIELDVLTDPG